MAAASLELFEQGNVAMHAGDVLLARACYERATLLDPNLGDAHFNLGATYQAQGLHHLALPHYERGVALMADPSIYLGNVLNTKMRICDWQGLDALMAQIESRVLSGQKTCPPFQVVSFSGSPIVQRKAAELWMNSCPMPEGLPLFVAHKKAAHQKIRIAYFSADFGTHPVSYLTAEMFELHDKAKFELVAFSNGHASADDPYRARITAAFDEFIDIRNMPAEEVILLARQMEIDLAIDLTGLTQGGRTDILMARIAPVQVQYLGYSATTSTPNVDYVIADDFLIPESAREDYSEKVIYLPHNFQISDRQRVASSQTPTRQSLGLPSQAFVFCGFCNTYKITPIVFDSWMRILHAVPTSVLVLATHSDIAQSNLRRAAQERGIDNARLIFAERLPSISEYLARYRSFDLFLDTFPYNAGSTANDVLRMGLPLLTLTAQAMTSRMAASLLHTLDLDPLITMNWADYEACAIKLATQSEYYDAIKNKLLHQRKASPLFDTPKTTLAIERGYLMALERYWQGLEPDHIFVTD